MKVAICSEILTRAQFTGVENYTYNLISALIKTKKEWYSILCRPDMPEILFENKINKVMFKPLHYDRTKILSSLFYPPGQLDQFDIIHCPTVIPPLFFKPKNTKVMMTVHDLIPLMNPEWQIMRRKIYFKYILKHRFKFVDKFIAVSENTKKDMIRFYNIRPDKIEIVYPGVDPKFRPAENGKKDISEKYILFVGTIEPRKNIRRIIESFIKLKKKYGVSEKLYIVGTKGWKYHDLYTPEAIGSGDICFLGYVSEEKLINFYQNATLFIYPSLYEGFGLPVLEAMACGCPVVTSNRSSLSEIANDACETVDPYDIFSMTEAMYKIVSRPDLQKHLSVKGLKRAAKFSWERCANETNQVYQKVFAK